MLALPETVKHYSMLKRSDPLGRYPEHRAEAFHDMEQVLLDIESTEDCSAYFRELYYRPYLYNHDVVYHFPRECKDRVSFIHGDLKLSDRPILDGLNWIGGFWFAGEAEKLSTHAVNLGSGVLYLCADSISF